MLEKFRELYINNVINGDGFTDELNELFDRVLIEEFNEDGDRMSSFINEIVGIKPEPTIAELVLRIEELEDNIRQLTENR